MNTVCTVPPPAMPMSAMWMSDEIPGAVGRVDKTSDNGGYESLRNSSNIYYSFNEDARPLPPAPDDSRPAPPVKPPAPPVKPRPKPELKPKKSADDEEYLHFS